MTPRSRPGRPPRAARALLALALVAPLSSVPTGCAGAAPAGDAKRYTLVRLETGPRTDLTDAERSEVFAGHFANMERLARDGALVLAGPYGKQKSDPRLRGLFVLDTSDRDHARSLAESDPGFAAGVFRFSFATIETDAPLGAHAAADLADHDAAVAAGRRPRPGDDCRNYVWLTADHGDAAAAVFARDPAALLIARLESEVEGVSGFRSGRAMVLLDAQDVAAATALAAPLRERIGPFVLDQWFGSRRLASRR